jgi:hypothetical protein
MSFYSFLKLETLHAVEVSNPPSPLCFLVFLPSYVFITANYVMNERHQVR